MATVEVTSEQIMQARAALAPAVAKLADADGLVSTSAMLALGVVVVRALADNFDLVPADIATKLCRAIELEGAVAKSGATAGAAVGVEIIPVDEQN